MPRDMSDCCPVSRHPRLKRAAMILRMSLSVYVLLLLAMLTFVHQILIDVCEQSVDESEQHPATESVQELITILRDEHLRKSKPERVA